MSKLRSRKPNKKLEKLIDEALDRDLAKVKAGTHKWVYDPKTKVNRLKCIRKKK